MTQPVWVEASDVLRLHDRLLALDGGMAGLRDAALLESALARPQQLHAYAEGSDIIDMAAAYTAALLQNHVFLDGNKRTGFVVGILFLEGISNNTHLPHGLESLKHVNQQGRRS